MTLLSRRNFVLGSACSYCEKVVAFGGILPFWVTVFSHLLPLPLWQRWVAAEWLEPPQLLTAEEAWQMALLLCSALGLEGSSRAPGACGGRAGGRGVGG